MKLKVSWKRKLSDGTMLQVVYRDRETMIELIPPHGADHPATEDGGECVRLGPLTKKDAYWLTGAIDESTSEATLREAIRPPPSRKDHAEAAIGYLANAEGAASCSAAGDLGVPADVTAAVVLIRLARELLCKAFDEDDPGKVLPEDAP